MEALILDNFDRDSWWCTFTFRDSKLPPTRALVSRRLCYFTAQLRAAGYPNLRYLKVPEHRHGAGRWHLHCVIDGAPKAVIEEIWLRLYGSPDDRPRIKRLDPTKVVPHDGKNLFLDEVLLLPCPKSTLTFGHTWRPVFAVCR